MKLLVRAVVKDTRQDEAKVEPYPSSTLRPHPAFAG